MTTLESSIESVDPANAHFAAASARRPTPPSPLAASLTHGWRALLKIKHVPWQLIDVTLFPILLTLMMSFIFGGALAGSVKSYIQTVIPGILVMTVAMVSQYTAQGLNIDVAKGIFDRFRALPFWRPAVLVGALLGDTVRYATAGSVIIGLGWVLGFRPAAGLSGILASMALLLIFAFSLSWIWTSLGLLMDNPESAAVISSLATFPLTFVSNVFVDPATLPAFLRPVVAINPISLVVTAIRGLMHGSASVDQIGAALLACGILILAFGPLTMRLYNRKGLD
jgi:ABC-2 type transport system permease protein